MIRSGKAGKYTSEDLENLKAIARNQIGNRQELRDRLDFITMVQSSRLPYRDLYVNRPRPQMSLSESSEKETSFILTKVIKNLESLHNISTEELKVLCSMDLEKMIPLHGICAKKIKTNAKKRLLLEMEIYIPLTILMT